jgi:S1-C subfamily serine protease/Flp pilus assembly protein TadD
MSDEPITWQPPASSALTVEHDKALDLLEQRGSVVADNPENARIADRAASGTAEKHGSSYVVDPALSGIAGWLILPALNLFFSPLWTAFSIYQDCTFLGNSRIAHLHSVLLIEILLLSGMLLFQGYVAVAFFRRQRATPKLVIALLIARVVSNLIDWLAVVSVTRENPGIGDLLGSLVVAVVWIPYFLRSKRVKATFILGGATSNAGAQLDTKNAPGNPASPAPNVAPQPETGIDALAVDPEKEPLSAASSPAVAAETPPLPVYPTMDMEAWKWRLFAAIPVAFALGGLGWYALTASKKPLPPASQDPESAPRHGTAARDPESAQQDSAAGSTLSAATIFAQASPAVVQVVVRDQRGRTIGNGSGFLISKKGLIATNYHVIERAHSAHVVLANKTQLSVAGVVTLDQSADIAVLKVAGKVCGQPLELAGNDLPPVGAKVYTIGNPLGLANTLSDGLVSGHRETGGITVIQTTAPISPGSSGGPLLGNDGRVVGVTTAFLNVGQNLNFAVSASQVARLLVRCEGESELTQFPLGRQREAWAYFDHGNSWLERKAYDKAIKDFSEAIRLDPKNASAYASRGWAWFLKGEYNIAIKDFDEAIRHDPRDAGTYLKRGKAWYFKEAYDKSIKDFDETIRLDPKDAHAYFCRGNAWWEKEDYDQAIRDYDQAIRLDPSTSSIYTMRGINWFFKQNFAKAIKDFDEAIRLDPKDASAYYFRGYSWKGKNDDTKANRDLRKASELDPKQFPIRR